MTDEAPVAVNAPRLLVPLTVNVASPVPGVTPAIGRLQRVFEPFASVQSAAVVTVTVALAPLSLTCTVADDLPSACQAEPSVDFSAFAVPVTNFVPAGAATSKVVPLIEVRSSVASSP